MEIIISFIGIFFVGGVIAFIARKNNKGDNKSNVNQVKTAPLVKTWLESLYERRYFHSLKRQLSWCTNRLLEHPDKCHLYTKKRALVILGRITMLEGKFGARKALREQAIELVRKVALDEYKNNRKIRNMAAAMIEVKAVATPANEIKSVQYQSTASADVPFCLEVA